MTTINVKRKDAAKALDAIASATATTSDIIGLTQAIGRALREAGIQLECYEPCSGMAHQNPHVDNCSLCAPRWGVTGPEIKVT